MFILYRLNVVFRCELFSPKKLHKNTKQKNGINYYWEQARGHTRTNSIRRYFRPCTLRCNRQGEPQFLASNFDSHLDEFSPQRVTVRHAQGLCSMLRCTLLKASMCQDVS